MSACQTISYMRTLHDLYSIIVYSRSWIFWLFIDFTCFFCSIGMSWLLFLFFSIWWDLFFTLIGYIYDLTTNIAKSDGYTFEVSFKYICLSYFFVLIYPLPYWWSLWQAWKWLVILGSLMDLEVSGLLSVFDLP